MANDLARKFALDVIQAQKDVDEAKQYLKRAQGLFKEAVQGLPEYEEVRAAKDKTKQAEAWRDELIKDQTPTFIN